jgi:hypothetical protein
MCLMLGFSGRDDTIKNVCYLAAQNEYLLRRCKGNYQQPLLPRITQR